MKMSTDMSLVAAQLGCCALLLFAGDLTTALGRPYVWAIGGAALVWSVVAVVQLGRSYSVSTRPQVSAAFVDRGIYRLVRHPIYTGLMAAALAFAVVTPTLVVGVAYLVLVLVTNARAGIEEHLLAQRYPEYEAYRQRTKRYIPFIL